MSENQLPRRTVLKLAGLGAAGAVAPRWAFAGPFQASEYPIPLDKKLSPEWIASLTARGEPKVYTGAALNHIGMPVGGIGCGLVYLSGDGRLWHWDIFNYNTFGVYPGRTTYHGQSLGSGDGAAYVDPPKPESPFKIDFSLECEGKSIPMDSTGWGQVTFHGRYPIGTVRYSTPSYPLEVELEAFSPFVPLETDDSSLPVTIMRYRVKNVGDKPVGGSVSAEMENPVLLRNRTPDSRLRTAAVRGRAIGFLFSAEEVLPQEKPRPRTTIEDFQHPGYGGWKTEGSAFGSGPIRKKDAPSYQGSFGGPGDWMVNSHATAPGNDVASRDAATGKLASPPFRVNRKFLNFWIGGGNHPNRECLNVVVDGKVVATATGHNSEQMRLESLDVRAWEGQPAIIEIVDAETGGWGHINVGPIWLSDVREGGLPLNGQPDFGTAALCTLDPAGTAGPSSTGGTFGLERLPGPVSSPFDLKPGESHDAYFVVAWHFPNVRLGIPDDAQGRHYKVMFKDAAAVAEYVATHPELLDRTRRWVQTWYEDSTLPHWFLNRTISSASTLATSTCFRLATGRFYANEGVGCCAGTCTHVWHYAHCVARLFPALERDTRERVDLGVGFAKDTGEIWFRAEFDHSTAVDGQAGTILRFLREHQMAPDSGFLTRNWPKIRKSIEFLIAHDAGETGLLKGPQGNTLDAIWYGENSWLSSLYLAALLAGEQMAMTVGDNAFAAHCHDIFTRGAKNIEDLYNGEYYYQRHDPLHPTAWGAYDACHVDQVFGQSWAYQVGLPRVLPRRQTRSALEAIWKYNFCPNIGPWREAHPKGRWYAIEGDAGLIVAVDTEGHGYGDPNAWQNIYFIETWTGVEHQVAGHMIAEGMLTEGLSVVKAVDDRHDGNRRNPYNEIECSDHYSRAMSSFGPYVSLTGFEIDGPAGHLGFQPKLSDASQQFAWVGAEGWGSYALASVRDGHSVRLDVRHGRVALKTFKPGIRYSGSAALSVRAGDASLDALPSEVNGWLMLTFPKSIELHEGETLEMTQKNGEFGDVEPPTRRGAGL